MNRDEVAAALEAAGITRERVGEAEWELAVTTELHARSGGPAVPGGRRGSPGLAPMSLTWERVRAWQTRNRAAASAGELARARANLAQVEAEEREQAQGVVSRCPLCDGARYVRLDVPHGQPGFGRPVPCSCSRTAIAEERVGASGVPLRYRASMTFARWSDSDRDRRTRELMEQWTGRASIVLSGPPGTGKTHLSIASLLRLIRIGHEGRWVRVPELLEAARAEYDGRTAAPALELAGAAELLVLDDFGAERVTPWAEERLLELVEQRLGGGRATVLTTNLGSISEVRDVYGERIASRLATYHWLRLTARDHRQEQRGCEHGVTEARVDELWITAEDAPLVCACCGAPSETDWCEVCA